jgi:serine/threonine protein kinase
LSADIILAYQITEKLYDEVLSPSVIYLTKRITNGTLIIQKETVKSKLMSEDLLIQARREYSIQQLFNHPNIVKLHEYTENEESIIAFMEQCNDANYLEQQIYEKKKEIRDEAWLKAIAKQILQALQVIHSKGVIHADLKLPNILIHREEEKPTVKICDFGISLTSDQNNKATMKVRSGTAGYIAPEVTGKDILVGPEIDMWAFGVILYELCVAYKPIQVKNYRYGTGPIPIRARDWRHL